MGLFCGITIFRVALFWVRVVCTLRLSPDISCTRKMSSHTVPSVHVAWSETCEHFVLVDSGDSLAGRWDDSVTLGSLPGLGEQKASLLWCVAVVHRFAEVALCGDQAIVLSLTGTSWASASQRTWVFS